MTTNSSIDGILEEIPEPLFNKICQNSTNHSASSFFEPIELNFVRRFANASGRISKTNLEELLLQKITESLVFRTKYTEIRCKLDECEEIIKRQKNRIELLEKQYSDLDVTHKGVVQSMRENPQSPIELLKIVRTVSCQVYHQADENGNGVASDVKTMNGKEDVLEITSDEDDTNLTELHIDEKIVTNRKDLSKSSQKSTKNASTHSKKPSNDSKTSKGQSLFSTHQKRLHETSSSSNRGTKRQALTILDSFEKRRKSSTETGSSSDELPSVQLEIHHKMTNASQKNGDKSRKSSTKPKNETSLKPSTNLMENFKVPSKKVENSRSRSSSLEIVENDDEMGEINYKKSNDLETIPENGELVGVKKAKSGPMCSKLKRKPQRSHKIRFRSKNFETFLKNQVDSVKKYSNLNQSLSDTLNSSTFSLFNPQSSGFQSIVTSTPLKAIYPGPLTQVKKTLDLNFRNKNTSKSLPALPPRGPQMLHPKLKDLSPAPTIKVEKVENGIRITWRIDDLKVSKHADIQSYQIFAYEEQPGITSSDDWRLVGDVQALLLPMAVTLREFNEDQRFYFAVRAVDVHKRFGDYSESRTWD